MEDYIRADNSFVQVIILKTSVNLSNREAILMAIDLLRGEL